jgi:hypothetical protein
MNGDNVARAQQDWNEAIRTLFEVGEHIGRRRRVSRALYDEWVTARLRVWIARERLRAVRQGRQE